MARTALTTSFDRLFDDMFKFSSVGYEPLFARAALGIPTYPKYDIVKVSDTVTEVLIAVAGFGRDEISVSMDETENLLKIAGSKSKQNTGTIIHRGIASRDFNLSLGVYGHTVKGAGLKDGILTVTLEAIVPEKKITKIEIQ